LEWAMEGPNDAVNDSALPPPDEAAGAVEVVAPVAVVAEPDPEPGPVTTQVVIRRTASPAWAVAAVFLGIVAAATFLIYTVVYSVPAKVIDAGGDAASAAIDEAGRLTDRLAGAFRPSVNVSTVVSSGIENVKQESKLVVMTAEVDVEIGKSSEKRVLWETLKLGDTTVRLRVRDNKVQYVVPLKEFGLDDVEYHPEQKCLVVTVPPPLLDTEMVEVQSNPDNIDAETEVGWGRLEMYSGAFLMDEAKRALRDAVLREGASPLLREKAKAEAESAMRTLLKDWVPNLREDVTMRVEFDSGPN